MADGAKIGFFDSGVGGLTILNAVRRRMPQYDYVFYGDTHHLPYGNRAEKEIYDLTKKGITYLFQQGASLVIIACNTASAETLRRLQDEHTLRGDADKKILGVIIPTIEELIERRCTQVLLIGTERTIHSQKYEKELAKRTLGGITLDAHATPELVPFIESREITRAAQSIYGVLDAHLSRGGDGVILGCTHYTVLKKPLRDRYGKQLEIFSQDEIIPPKLLRYLQVHEEFETNLSRGSSVETYMTHT